MGKNVFVSIAYGVLLILQTIVQHNHLNRTVVKDCKLGGTCRCNIETVSTKKSFRDEVNSSSISQTNLIFNNTELIAKRRVVGKASRKKADKRSASFRLYDN